MIQSGLPLLKVLQWAYCPLTSNSPLANPARVMMTPAAIRPAMTAASILTNKVITQS